MSAKILLIDDDPQFLKAFDFAFGNQYRLSFADSLQTALIEITKETFDLIFLDHHIEQHTGFEVLEKIRESKLNKETPITVVTALPDLEMTIEYLNTDVEGFITKPINYLRTSEKIQSLLDKTQYVVDVDWLKVDKNSREVSFENKTVILTPTELSILAILLKNPGKSVSREEICKRIWGTNSVSKNAFDTHLLNLRKKVPLLNERLSNVYGSGYILSR